MLPAVNLLKSGPGISDRTKGHYATLKLFDINGTLGQKCCCEDSLSVLDPLTR